MWHKQGLLASVSSLAKWSIIILISWTLKRITYSVWSAHMMLATVRVPHLLPCLLLFLSPEDPLFCPFIEFFCCWQTNSPKLFWILGQSLLLGLGFCDFVFQKSALFLWILPSQFSALASFWFTNSEMCFFWGVGDKFVWKQWAIGATGHLFHRRFEGAVGGF